MHTTNNNQETQHHARDVSLAVPTPDPAMQPLIPGPLRMTADRADKGTREMHFPTTTPRWALSPLDWHAHAIDTWADHPLGLWIARCGHRLLGGTSLHDTPPGHRCKSCVRWSSTTEPGAGQ